jgi:peptidoglycan/LPS O-acetylase OafA/YrhL
MINSLKRLIKYGRKYIDYRMGMYGAIVMATIVFIINYYGTQDIIGATTAALKQGTYTFFFGGIIMRMSERIATEVNRRLLALILACVIPSMVSLTLTFGLHSLKGTPKPLASTIPTAIFVIPSTFIWGLMSRKRLEKTIATKEVEELS